MNRQSPLDDLPDEVQRAIYQRFLRASLKDKIIFLSRLEYGNDLPYRDISNKVGVSVQRIQYIVDNMFVDIRQAVASGVPSGVYS